MEIDKSFHEKQEESQQVPEAPSMNQFERRRRYHYNGGVLPYSFINGRAYFLLGCDKRKRIGHCWSDFGGQAKRKEHIVLTAGREFSEETLGVFADTRGIGSSVKASIEWITSLLLAAVDSELMKETVEIESLLHSVELDVPTATQAAPRAIVDRIYITSHKGGNKYTMFIVPVPYVPKSVLEASCERNKVTENIHGAEKRMFEWVDARLLLDFIVSLKKDFTQKDLYLKVNDETSLLLFDKFVKTLLDSEGEKIITQIISIESEPSLIAEICPKYGVLEKTICRYFMYGNCKHGSACKFLHLR